MYKFQPTPNAVTRQLANDHLASNAAQAGAEWYPHANEGVTRDMQALLRSMRGAGVGGSAEFVQPRRNPVGLGESGGVYPNAVPMSTIPHTQTQARHGFTPAEELILHAHAQAQSQTNTLGSLRGTTAVGRVRAGSDLYQQPFSPANPMPPSWEEEFHAQVQGYEPPLQPRHQFDSAKPRHNPHIHPPHVNARLSNYDNLQHQRQQEQGQEHDTYRSNVPFQIQNFNASRHPNSNASAHIRSTAIPPSSLSQPQLQRQYIPQQQHSTLNSTNRHSHYSNNMPSSINTNNSNSNSNNEPSHNFFNHNIQHGLMRNVDEGIQIHEHEHNHTSNYPSHAQFSQQHNYDIDISSPPLISPALTYNSARTPSTLSPATPFFGSFAPAGDGFENVYGGRGKKVRAGSR